MLLNLHILHQAFVDKGYETIPCIREDSFEISSYVLELSPSAEAPLNVLRNATLKPANGSMQHFSVSYKANSFIIKKIALSNVINILNHMFQHYNNLEQSIRNTLTDQSSIQSALKIMSKEINRPMLMKGIDRWVYATSLDSDVSGHDHFFHPTTSEAQKPLQMEIRIADKKMGELLVLENGFKFTKRDIGLLHIFRSIIEAYINENIDLFLHQSELSLFLVQAIKNDLVTQQASAFAHNASGWSETDLLAVAAIALTPPKDSPSLDDCRKSLLECVSEAAFFYENGSLVCTINLSASGIDWEELHQYLKVQATRYAVRYGLSYSFTNFVHFKKNYSGALESLSYAEKSASQGDAFPNVACNYISAELRKNVLLRNYIHPIVSELQQIDETSGSNFTHTLFWYLILGRNTSNAAKSLNIHRNTLLFRIKKIKERTGLNFCDPSENKWLLLSLLIIGPC